MGEPRNIKFKKNESGTYSVFLDGKHIGYVFSREGFSYRGTNGWNSGIRCRDFHPTKWHYSERDSVYLFVRGLGRRTRKRAVKDLLEHIGKSDLI